MSSKVAIAGCSDYDPGRVHAAVEAAVNSLGGISAFVRPGQTVFIKPNMLTDREPEKAVTTHPEVIRAVIRLVKAGGGEPTVGDSPASVMKLTKVWEKTGIQAVCDEEGVPIVSLEKAGSRHIESNGFSFSVSQPVIDADVVISVPKVKTHVLTILTAAIKNLYGTVPGYQKIDLHKNHPAPVSFGELLSEIYRTVKPGISIADGIVGMEGDGPSGGSPVTLGFIAASADGVALDTMLCKWLGIRINAVPYMRWLKEKSLGETDWEKIEVLGDIPAELRDVDFHLPGTLWQHLIPTWLVHMLKPYIWIRPAFIDLCIFCGKCAEACPAKALTVEGKNRPVLDSTKCIECCCCHEVCPKKAVEMTQSPFLNFIRKGRMP